MATSRRFLLRNENQVTETATTALILRALSESWEKHWSNWTKPNLQLSKVERRPEASHQGGIWKLMVRSVRKILGALLKEQLVNDETLLTLLCEVERILNDRPLTPLSYHPVDPGHCKYRFEDVWHFYATLAWFSSPWNLMRSIPVLRRGWWAVFQHGRLSWAPPSWILNSTPDLLQFVGPWWIWKTIATIVLETIAYCSSRLLIGYRSYDRALLLLTLNVLR